MSANKQEIFGIIEQEKKSDDEWIVRGRVYTTIAVGQKVYVYIENDNGKPDEFPFKVLEIRFYDKSVTELTEGLTCELIVKGDNAHILINATRLFA
jgi:hypothetical protein